MAVLNQIKAGSFDIPLDVWGGTLTEVGQSNMPAGGSPANNDVEFLPGLVRQRRGLISEFGVTTGLPNFNYLKTFYEIALGNPTLAFDSNGKLYSENSPFILSQVGAINAGANGVDFRAKSITAFGREYIGFYGPNGGVDIPRQWDGTNLDRVSQVGPGASPTAADFSPGTIAITASPNGLIPRVAGNITNIVQTGQTCFLSHTSGGGSRDTFADSRVGDIIAISGNSVAAYNGNQTLTAIGPGSQVQFQIPTTGNPVGSGGTASPNVVDIFPVSLPSGPVIPPAAAVLIIAGSSNASYNGTWSWRFNRTLFGTPQDTVYIPGSNTFAASGGGTISQGGNISAGVHQVTVMFKTRQGYITKPAQPNQWTAAGGLQVQLTNIPTGPSNVIQRIIMFTASGQASFFYIPSATVNSTSTIINDNTTTTAQFNFTDSDLVLAQNGDNLFNLVELGEVAGFFAYNQRLFAWGERNRVNNFVNMTFDGGWGVSSTDGKPIPLGWLDGGMGGTNRNSSQVIWGDAFQIDGNGTSSQRGLIYQSASFDYLGTTLLAQSVGYSVRVRLACVAPIATGNFFIQIETAVAGAPIGIVSVPCSSLTTTYQEFTGQLFSPTTIPSTAILEVYVDSGVPLGASVLVENIEIFPTLTPQNLFLRASLASQPEAFDGVTGLIIPSNGDGQDIHGCYMIRDLFHMVRDRSIFVTRDDGINEPSNWTVDAASRVVGMPGTGCLAVGEDWAVMADRYGMYFHHTGGPWKISQEIQTIWRTINWAQAWTIWTEVDLDRKQVLIGVPLNGALKPNAILVMDYQTIDDPTQIALYGTLRFSVYSGRRVILEQGRKWTTWNISSNCGSFVERQDGTAQIFMGNNVGNGKIYGLSQSQFTDDGASINSSYTTFFTPNQEQEQAFHFRSHRHLLSFGSFYIFGNGVVIVNALPNNINATPISMPPISLSNPQLNDWEETIKINAERIAFQFSSGATGTFWQLERHCPTVEDDPNALVRRGT